MNHYYTTHTLSAGQPGSSRSVWPSFTNDENMRRTSSHVATDIAELGAPLDRGWMCIWFEHHTRRGHRRGDEFHFESLRFSFAALCADHRKTNLFGRRDVHFCPDQNGSEARTKIANPCSFSILAGSFVCLHGKAGRYPGREISCSQVRFKNNCSRRSSRLPVPRTGSSNTASGK